MGFAGFLGTENDPTRSVLQMSRKVFFFLLHLLLDDGNERGLSRPESSPLDSKQWRGRGREVSGLLIFSLVQFLASPFVKTCSGGKDVLLWRTAQRGGEEEADG